MVPACSRYGTRGDWFQYDNPTRENPARTTNFSVTADKFTSMKRLPELLYFGVKLSLCPRLSRLATLVPPAGFSDPKPYHPRSSYTTGSTAMTGTSVDEESKVICDVTLDKTPHVRQIMI